MMLREFVRKASRSLFWWQKSDAYAAVSYLCIFHLFTILPTFAVCFRTLIIYQKTPLFSYALADVGYISHVLADV